LSTQPRFHSRYTHARLEYHYLDPFQKNFLIWHLNQWNLVNLQQEAEDGYNRIYTAHVSK